MRELAACVAACLIVGAPPSLDYRQTAPVGHHLYDQNTSHLWNRVHDTFHVRVAPDGSEYGLDAVDPLMWRETRHLLTGDSHARALGLLDEFLTSNGERLIRDPLKRAVFQNDLWAIFDWLVKTSDGDGPARMALEQRLARVIRRVALTRKEIEALPDTYALAVGSRALVTPADPSQQRPSFPHDLFNASGPWVTVGSSVPMVPQHAAELAGSAFIVLWNVPGGSSATLAYLRKLWDFPEPYVSDEMFQWSRDGELRVKPNPALPAVPDGTRIALVRKMLLIDDTGAIAPSNVVQSIQVRAFPGRQAFSEFRMSRADLFNGTSGGLRSVGVDERDFITFSAQGTDPLEAEAWRPPLRLGRVLDGCTNCHQIEFHPGIATVLSLRQMVRPSTLADPRHDRWARYFTQPIVAAEAKARMPEWAVLKTLWQTQPR
jgi:hypothetical protein